MFSNCYFSCFGSCTNFLSSKSTHTRFGVREVSQVFYTFTKIINGLFFHAEILTLLQIASHQMFILYEF